MITRFLAVNSLAYLQDKFATAIAESSLVHASVNTDSVVSNKLIRVLATNNADQLTVVGVADGHQEMLFDLDGVIYITPDSWLEPKYKNTQNLDFKFIEAVSIDQVSITATHEMSETFGVIA